VRFVGWVDPPDVTSWLAAPHVVVAPTKSSPAGWVEAHGQSIVEAMAAARPVVATRTGGIGDAITDGRTGVLIDEGDPAGLARAVLDLHDDPDRAHRLATAARERAVAEYDAGVCAERMSIILRSAADTARGTP
jgi:glycosyltransferase involved in cell wall biosynthesis